MSHKKKKFKKNQKETKLPYDDQKSLSVIFQIEKWS